MFPSPAAANRSIFYDRQGNARSVADVYAVLNARYSGAADSSATQTALAMYGASQPNVQLASAVPSAGGTQAVAATDSTSFLSQFPDVRNAVPAAAASDGSSQAAPANPIFRSLFQVDERSQPVSNTVHQLWGKSSSLTADAGTSAASDSGAPRPLDLFSDRNGTFSS
jgi:hypothetical protein